MTRAARTDRNTQVAPKDLGVDVRIEFDLLPGDVSEFVRYTTLESARARRFMRIERVALAGVAAALGLVRGLFEGDLRLVAFYGAISCLAGLPTAWIIPWLNRHLSARIGGERQSRPGGPVGRWLFHISNLGIDYAYPVQAATIPWQGIEGVDVTEHALYVFTTPVRAFIVVRRALSSSQLQSLAAQFIDHGVKVRGPGASLF
jgi:hypothetical protein